MILKLIKCEVDEDKKDAFSISQTKWTELSSINGFEKQFGGWESESREAIIFAYWKSEDHVKSFMQNYHDEILNKSNQKKTFLRCKIKYYKKAFEISPLYNGINKIGFVRVAHCQGVRDKRRFQLDQEKEWNPIMSTQPGMIGGDVWQESTNNENFLVVSYWESFHAHEQYKNSIFPVIFERVKPTEYIEQITGDAVDIVKPWSIDDKLV